MNEYPKILYKTRQERTKVLNIDEEEVANKLGYGDYSIVILGIKPEVVEDVEPVVEKTDTSLTDVSDVVASDADKPIYSAEDETAYTKETGKPSVYQGNPTKKFKNWLKNKE